MWLGKSVQMKPNAINTERLQNNRLVWCYKMQNELYLSNLTQPQSSQPHTVRSFSDVPWFTAKHSRILERFRILYYPRKNKDWYTFGCVAQGATINKRWKGKQYSYKSRIGNSKKYAILVPFNTMVKMKKLKVKIGVVPTNDGRCRRGNVVYL